MTTTSGSVTGNLYNEEHVQKNSLSRTSATKQYVVSNFSCQSGSPCGQEAHIASRQDSSCKKTVKYNASPKAHVK